MKKKRCPVCNSLNLIKALSSTDPRNKTNTNKFNYLGCQECHSIHLDPKHIKHNFYANYYSDKYFLRISGLKQFFEKGYSRFVNYRKLKLILKSANNHKINILDIGAGDMSFLKLLPTEKFNKYSIDMYSEVQGAVNDITMHKGDFLNYNFGKKKFDVIVSWHSIEHFKNVQHFLDKAYTLLKNGGVFYLSTPNLGSLGFRVFKANWYHLDAPRHVVLFNENSLGQLATKTGFKEVKNNSMFYEFPFDLWHSASKTKKFTKLFISLFYPLLKLIDRETMTLALIK